MRENACACARACIWPRSRDTQGVTRTRRGDARDRTRFASLGERPIQHEPRAGPPARRRTHGRPLEVFEEFLVGRVALRLSRPVREDSRAAPPEAVLRAHHERTAMSIWACEYCSRAVLGRNLPARPVHFWPQVTVSGAPYNPGFG